MFIQIQCPGCKATLQVEQALAGRQGKCIHCGHKIVVPGGSDMPPPPPNPSLAEASPEAMVKELHRRDKSALMLVFEPSAEGSYDLADVADQQLKCVVTEDVTPERLGQLVGSIARRFLPRKKSPAAQPVPLHPPDQPYDLKGDALGMTLEDFKKRYARFTPDGRQELPICSDESWGTKNADLHTEAWHRKAGIVHARIDMPAERNSPTVAGVNTDLLLYQFVDGQLFRMTAFFPTDLFHLVSEAIVQKYGPSTRETKQPRELVWENEVALIALTRGTVHPPTPSTLNFVHKKLHDMVHSRVPHSSEDI